MLHLYWFDRGYIHWDHAGITKARLYFFPREHVLINTSTNANITTNTTQLTQMYKTNRISKITCKQ